jgi:hypothetical protein
MLEFGNGRFDIASRVECQCVLAVLFGFGEFLFRSFALDGGHVIAYPSEQHRVHGGVHDFALQLVEDVDQQVQIAGRDDDGKRLVAQQLEVVRRVDGLPVIDVPLLDHFDERHKPSIELRILVAEVGFLAFRIGGRPSIRRVRNLVFGAEHERGHDVETEAVAVCQDHGLPVHFDIGARVIGDGFDLIFDFGQELAGPIFDVAVLGFFVVVQHHENIDVVQGSDSGHTVIRAAEEHGVLVDVQGLEQVFDQVVFAGDDLLEFGRGQFEVLAQAIEGFDDGAGGFDFIAHGVPPVWALRSWTRAVSSAWLRL